MRNVALNHFFSPTCTAKERRPAQVMVNCVTRHLCRFHLSIQRWQQGVYYNLELKVLQMFFKTLKLLNVFTISHAVPVAV